jgi:hypothetical protein
MTKKPKRPRTKAKAKRPSRVAAKTEARAKPRKAAAAPDPFDNFIESAAQALALPVEPSWQPAVKFNLQVILRQAALFTEFPLPDDAEPAPVFTA